jgi:putative acetyltransferase
VRPLREAGRLSVSLVAVDERCVIGHVAVSAVNVADGSSGWFGLGPVAVEPARQNDGVGTQLVHAALETLRQRGAAGCVVLGEPRYYKRFGFRADSALVLAGVPAAYFQALSLDGSRPRGAVRYDSAFSQASGSSAR